MNLLHKLCCVKKAEEGADEKRERPDEDELIRRAVDTIRESKDFKM